MKRKERMLKELQKKKFLSKGEREKLLMMEKKILVKETKEAVSLMVGNIKKEDSFDIGGSIRQIGQKNIFRFRGGR